MNTLRQRSIRLSSNYNVSDEDHKIQHRYLSFSPANSNSSSCLYQHHKILHKIALALGLLLIVVPWIHHSSRNWQVGLLQEKIEDLHEDQKQMSENLERSIEVLKKTRTDAKKLDDENAAILGLLKQYGDDNLFAPGETSYNRELYQKAENDEDAYIMRIDELESEIKRACKASLKERFGADPIRVKVQLKQDVLVLAGNGITNIKADSFTLEMNPIDKFPHSVDLFLRLVSSRFFDGLTLIHRSAGSTIIHTVPISGGRFVEDPLAEKPEAATRHLTFMEHSAEYPMQKYALCFMDKGPQFYIKMGHEIDTFETDERETCFANVSEGRATLEYIARNHAANKSLLMLGIESVRLIEKKQNKKVFSIKAKKR